MKTMNTKESQYTGITKSVGETAYLVWANRLVNAMNERKSLYPIYRSLHFGARIELQVLFDAIALDGAWRVERTSRDNIVIDGDGIFITGYGSRRSEYCSCYFYIWAADVARAEEAKQRIL